MKKRIYQKSEGLKAYVVDPDLIGDHMTLKLYPGEECGREQGLGQKRLGASHSPEWEP